MLKAKLFATAAAVAALLSSVSFAQNSTSAGAAGNDDAQGRSAGSANPGSISAAPNCSSMTGTPKERCLREQRSSGRGDTMGPGMSGGGMMGHGGMMNGGSMGGGMMGGGSRPDSDSANVPQGSEQQR